MNNKILLVSMPWASAKRPLLGIGILQSKLAKEGYKTSSLYLNVDFSKIFGFGNYEFFADNPSLYPLAEFLFSAIYFNYPSHKIDDFIRKSFGHEFLKQNPTIYNSIHNLKNNIIPDFIEYALTKILDTETNIIGFSSTFNQIFPSLLMAKKLKEVSPNKIILLGGSCFHDEMGKEYSFAFQDIIDYVFTGESDNSFPKFLKYLEGVVPFEEIDGIAHKGIVIKESIPLSNLKDTSIPNYDNYFDSMKEVYGRVAHTYIEGIPFESSRGCWWGQKNHCTFCGLNNMGMNYRSKEDNEVITELQHLASKYKTLNFLAADNIIQHNAYSSLLIQLSELPYKFNLFYEVKANLKRLDLYILHNSGVNWIQPGIESFSNNVLKIMKKGVSALINIQLLKFAKEYNINVSYNILTGFYGESIEDYEQMNFFISKIQHLQPPSGVPSLVQIHRFSPMHRNYKEYGYTDISPCSYYYDWFPDEFIDINKIAYFFECNRDFTLVSTENLVNNVKNWIEKKEVCFAELGYDFIIISRFENGKEVESILLDEIDSMIFIITDEIVNLNSISNKIESIIDTPNLLLRLHRLKELNILINDNDKYLNVVPFSKPVHPKDIKSWIVMAYERMTKNIVQHGICNSGADGSN